MVQAIEVQAVNAGAVEVRRTVTSSALARWRRAPHLATIILVVAVFFGLVGPLIAPYDPIDPDLTVRQTPPAFMRGGSMSYLLGTDRQGRDILSRVMVAARMSLTIAAASILLGGVVGTALGLIAGYSGGWLDAIIGRVVDGISAFPSVLVALALAVTVGPNMWVVVGVLGLVLWSRYARLVRGQTLAWKNREFVLAATVSGCSPARILVRHLLPNILSTVVVFSTLQVGYAILSEASLSFLGAGVPPPTPSWGGMIAEGRTYIDTLWWMSAFPGLAIALVVISANLFGDWLRDELDPQMTRS